MKVTREGQAITITFRPTVRDQAAMFNLLARMSGQTAVPTCAACGGLDREAGRQFPVAAHCRCAPVEVGAAPYAKTQENTP